MAELCIHIPKLGDPFKLTLPGGIEIEHLNLAEIIQPALTPLVPLFQIVDAVLAVFNCVKAIGDAFGPPPDPSKLASCIPELAEKVGALLKLIPQLSLPLTVIGLIDLLIAVLEQVRRELRYLQAEFDRLARVVDRAKELDDACLLQLADCTKKNIETEAANLGKQLASLGRLVGLLNLFLGMIGAPRIPDFTTLSGQSLDQVLPPLDAMVTTLKSVRSAVPVP